MPLISPAPASTPSSEPNLLISSAAVLGPMPATPGTLSMLSPISASTSPTSSGGTPNFSRTSSTPSRRFFMVSSTETSPSQSCIRSLSDEQITTCIPAALATLASVAMMSSASNPGTSSWVRPNASITWRVSAICARQLGRHRRAVRLVLGEDLVAEVVAGGVVDDAEVGGPLLALDAQDHLAEAVDGARLQPLGRGERRQRVEGAEQEVQRVDDEQARLRG